MSLKNIVQIPSNQTALNKTKKVDETIKVAETKKSI